VPRALGSDEPLALRKGQALVGALLAVRKYKGDKKLSMRAEVPEVRIACRSDERPLFDEGLADFKAAARAARVEFDGPPTEGGSATLSIPGTDFEPVVLSF
jgi:hypothetical protein